VLQNPVDGLPALNDNRGIRRSRRREALHHASARFGHFLGNRRQPDHREVGRWNDDWIARVKHGDLRVVPTGQEYRMVDGVT
jgi:hypothetical protein